MSEKGSIPEGYTAINELAENAVSIMCGSWSVAPLIHLPDLPGDSFTLNDGDGPQKCQNVVMRVKRAGIVIPAGLDTFHFHSANEEIRQLLINRQIMALVSHPSTGEHLQIGREYWNADKQEITFRDGIYYMAPDPDLEGRAVYVSNNDARAVLDWMRGNMALFTDIDWSYVQVCAWVLTRWPYGVASFSSRFRDYIGNQRGYMNELHMSVETHSAWCDPEAAITNTTDAGADILSKLRRGTITATGKKNGKGDRLEIPREFWIDIETVYYDDSRQMDYAAETGIPDPGQPAWGFLRFSSAQVIDHWPYRFPLPDAKASPEAETEAPANTKQDDNLPKKRPVPEAELKAFADDLYGAAIGAGNRLNRDDARAAFAAKFPNNIQTQADTMHANAPAEAKKSGGRPARETRE